MSTQLTIHEHASKNLKKVKNSFILFLFLVSLISCKSNTNQLEGNWYSCNSNDGYLELYTKKDSFRVVTTSGIQTSWTYYKIESDTMHYILPGGFKTDSIKAILDYNIGKSLSVEFINRNEKIEFKPLNFVVDNTENNFSFTEINKRSKSAECNGEFEKR